MNIVKRIWHSLHSNTQPSTPTTESLMANTENIQENMLPINVNDVNIEVPEAMIAQAAITVGGNNNFSRLLIVAGIYRQANLTPLYFTNPSQTALRVIAREYIETPHILN